MNNTSIDNAFDQFSRRFFNVYASLDSDLLSATISPDGISIISSFVNEAGGTEGALDAINRFFNQTDGIEEKIKSIRGASFDDILAMHSAVRGTMFAMAIHFLIEQLPVFALYTLETLTICLDSMEAFKNEAQDYRHGE